MCERCLLSCSSSSDIRDDSRSVRSTAATRIRITPIAQRSRAWLSRQAIRRLPITVLQSFAVQVAKQCGKSEVNHDPGGGWLFKGVQ